MYKLTYRTGTAASTLFMTIHTGCTINIVISHRARFYALSFKLKVLALKRAVASFRWAGEALWASRTNTRWVTFSMANISFQCFNKT